jgi:diguanylate cyclase (GGDEF)-like protein
MLPFEVKQLYTHARRSLLFLLLVTLSLALLLTREEAIPVVSLVGWTTVTVLVILLRMLHIQRVLKRLNRTDLDPPQAKRDYVLFFFGAIVTALLVGSVVPLFLPYLQDLYLRFTLFIYILGIAAGAMAALFPSALLAVSYTVLITLPLILHLLKVPDHYAIVSGLAILVLVLTLTAIAQVTRSYMQEVFRQRKRLQAKEEELSALFSQTPTPIFYFDTELKIRKYNEAFRHFFQIPDQVQLENFDLNQLKFTPAIDLMKEVIESGEAREYDGPYISTFQAKEYWIHAKVAPLYNADGKLIGAIASFQDRTLEVKSLEYLEELAALDPLTELGNRRSLLQHLQHLISQPNGDAPLSLLYYLDLNQFKPINDTLGHHFGDKVLKKVARLLQSIAPAKNQVFRHGGDEFVILHPYCCHDEAEARQRGAEFAQKVNRLLARELVIDQYHLSMHASVGIVIITPEKHNSDEIIRQADISMYQAKSQRVEYAFYDSSLDETRRRHFFLRQEMGREDFLRQLELHYQPIYALRCRRPVGAEALIRWGHPELGLLMPHDFIPLAVESGEIKKIGQWVREEACKTFVHFKEEGYLLEFISANVDAHELGYEEFTETTLKLFDTYDLEPANLVLEITENSLIDNFERYHGIFDTLKNAGVRWAIDDFGIGYSSLSYLERLAFSILKIDRSFVTPVEKNTNASFLIAHIVDIASRLGYQVIAEGIETEEQMKKLLEISPDIMCQGYYFKQPLPQEELCKLLPVKET